MKKIVYILAAAFAVLFTTNTNAQNLVQNGGFDDDSVWQLFDSQNSGEMANWEFGYEDDLPKAGNGVCLRAQSDGSEYGLNNLIWQKISLKVGSTYNIAGAFKDISEEDQYDFSCSWVQLYLSPSPLSEPVEGEDFNPANTIMLEFTAWKSINDEKLDGVGIDDTFEDYCTGYGVADPAQGTTAAYTVPDSLGNTGDEIEYLFGLKIGICGGKNGFDFIFDELSVTDASTSTLSPFVENEMSVFPNPVVDVLKINNSEEINSVRMYNLAGEEVVFQNIKNSSCAEIYVSDLKAGVYLVEIETKYNDKITKRVIKK